MLTRLRRQAIEVTDHLTQSVPGIDAVCLYGSVARGDEHDGSDIDLLVVGHSTSLSPSRLRARLPQRLRDAPVAFTYHTPETLATYLQRWSRFGAHVRREGEILFDPENRLRNALRAEIPVCTREELVVQERHLRNYDHLERFGGRFLLALAHLYSVGRSVIFALLAERGELVFDLDQAVARLKEVMPEVESQVATVTRLRPFNDRVSRRGETPFPFSPYHCEAELATARDAVRRLISHSKFADVVAAG